MTNEELNVYVEDKKNFFTSPDIFLYIEKNVDEFLQTSEFIFYERVYSLWLFGFLCFTIDTTTGRELYLKFLNHISHYCTDISKKYWKIYDKQENMQERYRF